MKVKYFFLGIAFIATHIKSHSQTLSNPRPANILCILVDDLRTIKR
jgi:hypothetical protein